MLKLSRLLTAAALCISTLSAPALAETKLTISTWVPPTHPVNTEMLAGLIEMMSEATGGEVVGELKHGLAPPPAQMELVMDGAADMTFIVHAYQPGRFTASKLVEIPGLEKGAEELSVAYWRVHEKHLEKANEHRGVKLVTLFAHGPGQIHSNKAIASLADLERLKIRLGGGVVADVGKELGMIGIQVPAPKVYETLASGAADAVAMNVGERIGFKLDEVARNLYEMPGGFYRTSFAVLMNQEVYDGLSDEAKAALESEVFGEPAARMMGAAWDAYDAAAYEAAKASADTAIVVASEADQAAFAETAAAIRGKVIAELAEAGIDAQAAYDMLVDEIAAQ